MGACTVTHETPDDEIFIQGLYDHFTAGKSGEIVKLAAPGATIKMDGSEKVPYSGNWIQGDASGRNLMDFFATIGKSWGGEKTKMICLKPLNFHTEGLTTMVDVKVRVLTGDGRVINGIEEHTWTLSEDKTKWTAHENTLACHQKAYDGSNQTELMARLCWDMFGEGLHKDIVEYTTAKEMEFKLLQDAEDLEKTKVVPYAGVFGREDMMKPFEAMAATWVFEDKKFCFKPTSFEAKDNLCSMTADICVKVKSTGKYIKFSGAKHICTTTIEDGVLVCKSWEAEIGASAAHINAYMPKKVDAMEG